MKLTETRAIVTGGVSGMGREFTHQFAKAGAKIVFCDVDPEKVAAAAEELGAHGVVADISDEEQVKALFDAAEAYFGAPANCLVNNAGIIRDGLLLKKDRETGAIKALSKAKWDAVLAVNLTGPFLCFREFAERAVAGGVKPAVCVNISSISKAGNMGQSNYSAAKAGIAADTVVWAKELGRYGVRVGAIAPGFIRTPMVESMPPQVLEKIVKPVPLGRVGEPEEIWQAVKFIVECEYFSGRVIEVDGGLRI
ncbi:MAG: SDR family oxidoreductase [Myxococcota bacterium]|nr:SDR family oxidoreductase [Myxococcota bacterium]